MRLVAKNEVHDDFRAVNNAPVSSLLLAFEEDQRGPLERETFAKDFPVNAFWYLAGHVGSAYSFRIIYAG